MAQGLSQSFTAEGYKLKVNEAVKTADYSVSRSS
jgi:hypothetical protein